MSDLYLKYQEGDVDIVIENGQPQLTGGLDNAVLLSLFVGDWWGNDVAEKDEKYDSEIPEIMAEALLGNETRLDIIAAAKDALKWMITSGIAERIEIDAEIPTPGSLFLAVVIYEPGKTDPEEYKYSLNWENQKLRLQEGTW